MSSIRLLVLGVVRVFQPIHGYDVRRELISWRAQEWGNVAPGSIYSAIKTLTREGYLTVSGTAQIGARPERTSYQLTPAGEREHTRLLRETWRKVRMPIDPLLPAVAFLPMLPRAELIGYLRERIQHIEQQLLEVRWAQQHLVATAEQTAAGAARKRDPDGSLELDDDFKPEHVYETFELLLARVGSEIEWARGLISRLQAGRYQMADDPAGPGVAAAPARKGPKARKPAPAIGAAKKSRSEGGAEKSLGREGARRPGRSIAKQAPRTGAKRARSR